MTYQTVITNYGEQLIANAIANNQPVLFKTMAIGDGNGKPVQPTQTQTALVKEVYRTENASIYVDNKKPTQAIFEILVPEDIGEFWVREFGLFDDKNNLVAVANCPDSYKSIKKAGSGKVQIYRMVLEISSSDAVELIINDNAVYLTREAFDNFKSNLSNSDGFKMVGQCESIEQLRTIEPTEHNQRILVRGYYAGSNVGGGEFYADLSDNTTPDNAGTVIVTAGGKRWKRVGSTFGPYDFGWSRVYQNADALKNANTNSLIPLPAYSYPSRRLLIQDAKSGKLDWLQDGTMIVAENAFYIRKQGCTSIPDIPNFTAMPEFEHIGNYKSGYKSTAKTSTKITYTQWHGVNINVIEINNPKLHTLKKLYAPNVADDGTALRVTPKDFAQQTGYKVVINCDGFRAPDGGDWTTSDYGKAVGLQISDGKLYQDWQPYENRDEAIVMLKTGELVAARKDDGISGQQWIELGALWSAAFVGFVVEDGQVVPHSSQQKSARTVLGQKADGTLIIFCAEGRTDEFGLTIQECGDYALSLGCKIAYCLDGGGSTQCWWVDAYANHSSDTAFRRERKCGSFLIIDDDVTQYDTGWQNLELADGMAPNNQVGARWRQMGKKIRMEFDIKYPFIKETHTPVTKNAIPESRRAYHLSMMKGAAVGDTGRLGGIYSGVVHSVRTMENTPYIVGNIEWTALETDVAA